MARRSTVARPSIASRPSFSGSSGGALRDGADMEPREHLTQNNNNNINCNSNRNNHPRISHRLVSNQYSRFGADSLQALPFSSTALTSLANWAQDSRHVCGVSQVPCPPPPTTKTVELDYIPRHSRVCLVIVVAAIDLLGCMQVTCDDELTVSSRNSFGVERES